MRTYCFTEVVDSVFCFLSYERDGERNNEWPSAQTGMCCLHNHISFLYHTMTSSHLQGLPFHNPVYDVSISCMQLQAVIYNIIIIIMEDIIYLSSVLGAAGASEVSPPPPPNLYYY